MENDLWRRLIMLAIHTLDERPPIDLSDSSNSFVHLLGPRLYDDNETPAVLEDVKPLSEALAKGPVLTELGFHNRPDIYADSWSKYMDEEPKPYKKTEREDYSTFILKHAVELSPGTDAVVLAVQIPVAWVSARSRFLFRLLLMDSLDLNYVLSSEDSEFKFACLVFSKGLPARGEPTFFQIPANHELHAGGLKDFSQLVNTSKSRSAYGYQAPVDPNVKYFSLGFDVRHPELLARKKQLRTLGDPILLKEIFEVSRPYNPNINSVKDADQSVKHRVNSDTPGAVRVVRRRDLIESGIAPANELSRYRIPSQGDLILQPGDYLVFRNEKESKFRVSSVTKDSGQLLAESKLIHLRSREETSTDQVEAAILFLKSEIATRLFNAYGSKASNDINSIKQISVPMPDRSTLDALSSVIATRNSLQEWTNSTDAVLQSLYARQDSIAAKEELLDLSRTLRSRVDQGRAQEDPGTRFRLSYHFPIASRWRVAESAYSHPDSPNGALQTILDAAETTTAYLACIALVLAREQKLELSKLGEVRKKFANGNAMSFGDWISILQEASESQAARKIKPNAPLAVVQQVFSADGFHDACSRLNKTRNGQSHGRRLAGNELDEAVEARFEDLQLMLEGAAPLSDLGLHYVEKAEYDSFADVTEVGFRNFRGDNSVVSYETTKLNGVGIEERSLYIRDTDNSWHLLRPYMFAQACPTCRHLAVFMIDNFEKGAPHYKYVDHDHGRTEQRDDLLGPLKAVGLVDPKSDE